MENVRNMDEIYSVPVPDEVLLSKQCFPLQMLLNSLKAFGYPPVLRE